MPDAYERHLQLAQNRRDVALGDWTCEGQAAIDDELDAAPADVTGGHVGRWISVPVDPDDARDLAIDDDLLDDLDDTGDEPFDYDDDGRAIEDVDVRGELL